MFLKHFPGNVPCISVQKHFTFHIEYFSMLTIELQLSHRCQSFSFIASASLPMVHQAVLGHGLPLLEF